MKYEFKNWLVEEGKDIFGFEKDKSLERKNEKNEDPIRRFDVEGLMEELSFHKIGEKESKIKFSNEVVWGEGNGAIRVWSGTGLKIIIERQGIDLEGTPRWVTKRVYQIDRQGYGGKEHLVSEEIMEQLLRIDKRPLDSPSGKYEDFEGLVASMAASLRRVAHDIFMFEGIRKVDSDNYIIRMGVRGQGIQAPDQRRVEENQTHVSFDKTRGTIRIMNYNIESSNGKQHEWAIMPSDTDWIFFPTQTREEIIETIANTLHWY